MGIKVRKILQHRTRTYNTDSAMLFGGCSLGAKIERNLGNSATRILYVLKQSDRYARLIKICVLMMVLRLRLGESPAWLFVVIHGVDSHLSAKAQASPIGQRPHS